MEIPFNKPYLTGKELENIMLANEYGQLSGDGVFTQRCNNWIEENTGCYKALLTHSCTAALEMAAILIGTSPGDEIIMPSYTFVSTANAFVLRGGIPVFVDIRPDTLNIDETLIESAITSKTKAIVPVHYAGVACDMDIIMDIANRHNLVVIEDAAQGVQASYKGKALGSIGHLGCYSFHETKNIISGEGGALLINDSSFFHRAEIIREKGTNRSSFFRGQVDKYTWVDVGSSYLPGELIAAFLLAQMLDAKSITQKRISIWNKYHTSFQDSDKMHSIGLPTVPSGCIHNAHMYYLLLPDLDKRTSFISYMKKININCVFHYVPLHTSPQGKKIGICSGGLDVSNSIAGRIVRLPFWVDLSDQEQKKIINSTLNF
jgi:dTDP-4-amino-4,6-dideoxygalactose transaminase